jgi:hypothetical protein
MRRLKQLFDRTLGRSRVSGNLHGQARAKGETARKRFEVVVR